MFYDERIEYERGRISRNCIIISVIGALIYGALNLTNILICIEKPAARTFLHFGIEIVIILSGIICLAVGFFKVKFAHDERTLAERNIFYNKSSMVHLGRTLAAWAFLMPFAAVYPLPSVNVSAMPYDYGLSLLFFPIVIYIVYSFKKHEIYFNYSILENEHYYTGVLKNIGKFGLRMLELLGISLFGLCLCIFKIKAKEFLIYFLAFIITYIFIFVTSSLLYLLLSALEKSSYDNQTKLISKSTVISFAVSVALTIVSSAIALSATSFINSLEQTDVQKLQYLTGMTLGDFVAKVSYFLNYINSLVILALVLSITYFCYEYRRTKQNRLLSASCAAILILKGFRGFFSACYRIVQIIVIHVSSDPQKYRDVYLEHDLAELYLFLTYLLSFMEIVAVALIILALVRDKAIAKGNIAALPIFAVLCGVALFLGTLFNATEFSYFSDFLGVAIPVYCAVLIALIGRKNAPGSNK